MERAPLIRSWGWAWAAVVYLTAVYATLPYARTLWRYVEPLLGGRPTLPFLLAGAALAAALAARAWTAGPARRVAALVLLAAVAAAYAWLLLGMFRGRVTVEKVHLIEYGVLAYLTLNAVTVTRRGGPGAVLAVLCIAAAGAGDEGLQKLIPNRVFEFFDIAANWLGGVLGAAAWAAASAASPWRQPSPGGAGPVSASRRP